MKMFKCCLDCGQRCEDCHSTCQAYKKEKTVNDLVAKQRRNKQKADAEFSDYNKSKSKKIEKAVKRKYR